MKVSKEEISHIAKLANLNIEEDKVDSYVSNLEEILNFANIVNSAPVEGLNITVGSNEAKNVFRKDEIEIFEDNNALMENAPEKEFNMFKIPKALN